MADSWLLFGTMTDMKYISWNINGYRAWVDKEGTVDFLLAENPDVICFQETKAQTEQIEESVAFHFKQWPHHFFNQAEKKGYSGTAVLSKHEPMSVSYGIDGLDLADSEGRVITVEYSDHFLMTVYTPNSKPDLARVDLRHDEWDKQFLSYMQRLEKKKPVVVCGDLNVAPTEIDLKNDATNRTTDTRPGSPGATDKERRGFANYLAAGFIDTWRYLYPEERTYSWWSYRSNARATNAGWRIDFFLASASLEDRISAAHIYDQVHGSDHCPVGLELQ